MADAYWRFAAAERGGTQPAGGLDPGRDFPGYLSRESSQPTAREFSGYQPRENSQPAGRDIPGYLSRENAQLEDRIRHSVWRAPPEFLRDGISPYHTGGLTASEIGGLGGASGVGLGRVAGSIGLGGGSAIALDGVTGGAGSGRMTRPTLEDTLLMGQRQGGASMEAALAGKTSSSEFYSARSDASLRLPEGAIPNASSRLPDNLRPDACTNTLFVEGLPTDCTRREVAHIFRPFIGFKQIRVIHKEPRHAEGEPYVLCFVEFNDVKCAATALEALQGYKFDDVEHESNALKLQFAHFPGSKPAVVPVLNELPHVVS
uniref:RRM domain-containing protein n=1 Tax=Araucaria cunninghamii TaxID=56994 RepID=A0A0D6R7Q5_ARACU